MNKRLIKTMVDWRTANVEKSTNLIRINSLMLHKLVFLVSFKAAMKKDKENKGLLSVLSNLGLALSTIEECPIVLNEFE